MFYENSIIGHKEVDLVGETNACQNYMYVSRSYEVSIYFLFHMTWYVHVSIVFLEK